MSLCTVTVEGLVVSEPISKISYGIEQIYEVYIEYKRLSGKIDTFLVFYSEGLGLNIKKGDYIKVDGELRSTIIKDDLGLFPKVYIMAHKVDTLECEPEQYTNSVAIEKGILDSDPLLRKSFNDDSVDIAEVVIKLPRQNNKKSMITCTSWNNNARLISKYKEGTQISAEGRLQSHTTKHGSLIIQVALSAVTIEE